VLPFEAEVRKITLAAPRIEIISTLTGMQLSAEQATDPRYWARHLREPVRFSPALRDAQARHGAAFLELGPRASLSTLARQHTGVGGAPVAIPSLGDAPDGESAQMTLAHGQLWTLGIELPVPVASPSQGRRRVRLPTYPFERKRFWIDAGRGPLTARHDSPIAGPAPAAETNPVRPAPRTEPIPTTTPTPTIMSNSTASAAAPRRAQLVNRLRVLFEDVAGIDLAAEDAAVSFVELGLDSLTLTQAALQVKKQFAVAITFRQLMEKYRSFDSLAEFLDASLPPDAAPAAAAAAVPVPAAQPAPVAMQPAAQPMQPVPMQMPMQMQAPMMAMQPTLLLLSSPSLLSALCSPLLSSSVRSLFSLSLLLSFHPCNPVPK